MTYKPYDPEFYEHCLNGCPVEDYAKWERAVRRQNIPPPFLSRQAESSLRAWKMSGQEMGERNNEIISSYEKGGRVKKIAYQFNLSGDRIIQILKKAGVYRTGKS